MKLFFVVCVAFLIVGLGVTCPGRVGDLGLADGRRAVAAGRDSFSIPVWRAGDLDIRGHMLADLARNHRFVGLSRDSTVALLGPSECYVVQDGDPCYRVELRGRAYDLQLPVKYWEPGAPVHSMRLVAR